MSPPAGTASRRVAAASAPVPRAPGARERGRPTLRVLDAAPRRRLRLLRVLSVLLVTGALLAVIVGHALLTQGQMRLSRAQAQVTSDQALHRQLLASVGQAENPSRIIAEAQAQHLGVPSNVQQLPAVPLNKPIGQSTTTTTNPTTTTPPSAPTTAAGTSAAGGR